MLHDVWYDGFDDDDNDNHNGRGGIVCDWPIQRYVAVASAAAAAAAC